MIALRRLFFAQPGLVDHRSRYFGEALGWKAACRTRGIEARFYVQASATPAVLAEFGAMPIFAYATNAVFEPAPGEAQPNVAASFAESYEAFARDGIGGDDIVVVTFASERDLLAAALWLSALETARRPAFVFIFHVPDFGWQLDQTGKNLIGSFAHWRYAMDVLKAVLPPEKTLLSATTEALATVLGRVLDHPCVAGPLPTFYVDDDVLAPIAAQIPRVNVRMAGELRAEYGAALINDTILRIAALRPGTSFGLQFETEAEARAAAAALEPLKTYRSLCRIHCGLPPPADYQARLKQSDIVLLPYQPDRYRLRASGVFSEAVGLGLVTVAPQRSWMAHQLAAGNTAGMLFETWRGEDIAAAVVAALDNYPVLAARAASGAASWRAHNCTAAMLDAIAARFAK